MNLVDIVLGAGDPDAAALREHTGEVTTYGQLDAGSRWVAHWLRSRGIGEGDGVLLAVRASARAVMAALGIVRAGAVVILADPGAGEALAEARRRVAPAKAAMAESVVYAATSRAGRAVLGRAGLQLPDLRSPGMAHLVSGPWLPGVPRGASRWPRTIPAVPDPPSITPGDALVVFTSGSTSDPRAVVHTHATLGHGIRTAAESLGFDEDTILCSDQLMMGLPVLAAGGRWSLHPVPWEPRRWLRQAARDGATHLYGIPHKMLAAARESLPESVRWIGLGGAPVLPAAVAGLQRPGRDVVGVYGMTECLPIAVATADEILASPSTAVCVGRPVGGATVAAGTRESPGEIVVTGPQVRDRYAGAAPSRAVHTGDLGYVDDGRVFMAGRLKRMILRGQANVYPDLVEPLIAAHFAGRVTDAALVGEPDPVTGYERVVAYLAPADTTVGLDELRRAWPQLADAGWCPDEVRTVAEIPRRGRSAAVDLESLGVRSVWSPAAPDPVAGAEKRRVAVTGASGFVGRAVVRELLAAGHEVLALSRRPVEEPGLEWRHWDLTQPAPELPAVDVVVHAAAHVDDWAPWSAQERVTVEGTRRVLAAFPDARVVLVSSCSVYPLRRGVVDEATVPTTRPLSPYVRAKIAQERLVTERPDHLILRPHAVYGPGDPTLLPRLARARRLGRFLVPAGASTLIHLTGVGLLARAARAGVESRVQGAVNVADAEPVPAGRLAAELAAANGWPERPLLLGESTAWAAALLLEPLARLTRRRTPPLLTRYAASHVARSRTFGTARLRAELGVDPPPSRLETWRP